MKEAPKTTKKMMTTLVNKRCLFMNGNSRVLSIDKERIAANNSLSYVFITYAFVGITAPVRTSMPIAFSRVAMPTL